ncbi:ApbE family lipoprotein [Methylobacterium sp. 4-46]|uniref:FAD:protein FMN transferase n=1 Tax=unclassified Methylobacterium TaxID=2615210 RepID=UPI000165C664|nr:MULTISPECIES: FAD:protein FMN transferase [Methylobacterium]ACA17999.1 ApbE family lipoprotein [Methylobacterium sp. 4-46]WFT77300.1 FAD:protein FMN transferase [Methylobacterium nodulans]
MRPGRRRLLVGAAGALAGLGGAGLLALARARGLRTASRAGLAFGTTVSLTLAGPDAAALEAALAEGFAEIRAVERAASLFRADSALSRLNREGRLDGADPHLLALARFALDLAAASAGAFDPTVQPLWQAWAEAAARGARPTPAALARAGALVDWREVRIDGHSLRLLRPGAALTLNGIAQGYAADRVMAALARRGVRDALIDTGELGAAGHRADGSAWRLGIAHPRRARTLAATVAPFAGFAATSGDYATAFTPDFRHHHIVDPATRASPPDLASVTVLAPSGLLADGLSTAAMVLGETGARALLARYSGCSGHFIAKI